RHPDVQNFRLPDSSTPFVYENSEVEEQEPLAELAEEEQHSAFETSPQQHETGNLVDAGERDFVPEFSAVQAPEKRSWTRILTMAIIAAALVLGWVLGRGGPAPVPAQYTAQPEP